MLEMRGHTERKELTMSTTLFPCTSTHSIVSSPARDSGAFAKVVHQTRMTLLGLAEGLLGDPDLAEDIVQDALLEAWTNFTPGRGQLGLARGLRQLVIERCRGGLYGGDRNQVVYAGDTLTLIDLAWEESDEGALPVWPVGSIYGGFSGPMDRAKELIALALESLPSEQRSPIELHYLQGLSLQETARALGMKKHVLMKRLGVSVKALKCSVRALIADDVPTSGHLVS